MTATRALLTLAQETPPTPGQPVKQPLPIPLKLALFGADSGAKLAEQLVLFEGAQEEVAFAGIGERPILSINRDFSAPIIVETDRGADDLAFLSAHDDNPFARYEAMQQLMLDTLLHAIATGEDRHEPVVEAVRDTLTDPALDPAFVAEAVLVPTESFIGDQMKVVDPDAIHAARERLRGRSGPRARAALARRLCRHRRQSLRALAGGQGRAPAAHGGLGLPDGRARRRRRDPGAAPVRRGRQHDRPAGRAGRARQRRRAGARDGARRLLRTLQGQRSGRSTNGSPPRRSPAATTRFRRCSTCSAIRISA